MLDHKIHEKICVFLYIFFENIFIWVCWEQKMQNNIFITILFKMCFFKPKKYLTFLLSYKFLNFLFFIFSIFSRQIKYLITKKK